MLSSISRRRLSLVCATFLVLSALSLTSEIGFSVSAGAAALQNNGDVSRNAWYQNESTLSQAALTSGQFGQRFATHLEGSIMGQPVVVNGTLVVGTEQDRIYGLDPATGVVKWSRIIGTPIEQAAQQGCGDLPIVGITASPVADPKTGAVYFLAKTEANDLSQRMIFQLHKVNASTGSELPNFPITYGGAADNDANIVFDGTYMTQRTGLLLDQGIVYAGFASVCDFGDFHGWVVGVDGSTGQTTSRFVTETGAAVGGGVWQSGVGIASDGPGQLLLTTGNGPTPAPGTPGNQPPGTLGQSIVRLSVQSDKSLKATDFFTPVTGEQLNDVDGDLGSSGPVVLPNLFHTNGASEILANGSKGGYLYLVNGKNLGGNGTGKNGGDATVATLGPIGAMFGSPVAWTGGGGYLYASSGLKGFDQGVAGPTLTAYKWGVNANGDAALTIAGSAREQPGFGSSSPVITSSGTSIPSAVLWQIWRPMAGGNAELRAFNPIPVNGQLQPIWSAPVGPLSKFLNPAVNNGWIYVGSNDGTLFGFGLAAKAPLALTSSTIAPTPAMTSKISTVVLSASRNVTITSISSTSARFAVSKVALPRVMSAGTSLSLPVTFKPVTSGSTSGSLVVAIAGEGSQAFALNSYGIYPGSRLTLSTSLLAMGNGGLGGPAIKNVFKVTNVGSTSALITTASGLRAPFSLTSSLLGKVILPGQSLTAGVAMALGTTGQFASALTVGTKTQTTVLNLVGSVGQPAIVTVSPSGISFGAAPVGQSVTRSITLTNTGNTPANWFVSRPYFLNSQASFTLVGAPTSSTLAPHASVTFKIQFSPNSEDTDYQGMLQFNVDDGLAPRQVWFSGLAVSPSNPMLNVGSVNVYPGDTTAWVPVELSPVSLSTVDFRVRTVDDTATALSGAFTAVDGLQASLAGGMHRRYVPISVNPALGAGKKFTVELIDANGASTGAAGTVYIRASHADSESFATLENVEFFTNQVEDQTVEVPLTIAPIMSAPATCRATTVDGTAKAASGDYVPLSNQVVTVPPTGLGSISVKVKATATPFAQKNFSVVVSNCTGDGALGITRSTSIVTLIGQVGQPSSVELQYQKVVIVAPGIGKIGYQNVLVRNVGGAAVTFTVASPISDSHFALVSPPTFPITIAAGQVYTMRFSYRATATALTRSSLSVQASTDQHAEIINLLGETG